MGAAGEAVAAAVAGCCIHLFKPVPRLAHHGVALSGMDLHAMAHRQVAQPQQLGDWYGIGAGQASAALAAEAGPQLLASLLLQLLQGLLLLGIERFIAMAQLPCPVQFSWAGGPQGEAADALGQQEAIGQFQRFERLAGLAQQLRWIPQLTALIGW